MFIRRYLFLLNSICISLLLQLANCHIDVTKTLVWGPGLSPAQIIMPARYFFVQLVDSQGTNISKATGRLNVQIGALNRDRSCRVWTDVLNRNDGSYIVRYKLYTNCNGLLIEVRYGEQNVAGFPLAIQEHINHDNCYCPQQPHVWYQLLNCPSRFEQVQNDLKQFNSVNMDKERGNIIAKFNKKGSMSLCNYVIVSNRIYRKCYGQYVGFNTFMDAILLSITRKVYLPNMEFFLNLGDWPLEGKGPNALPIFAWCSSDNNADIVLPTYDITESTLQCMGRVMLDMLSIQGNSGPQWSEKQPKAFWRGRDSREERLKLIDIARSNPDLFNASLTNFFFFRDKEKQYGPKQELVSFFDFFKYKYQISIDGTVAAYRLPYLLAGGSLVFKQESPYYEHFYSELIAGVHYVPVARDLSNLVDQLKWAVENDVEASRIAQQGAQFARSHLMPVDIFCYHVNVFTEWSKRLTSSIKVMEGMEELHQPEADNSCVCEARHTEL